MMSIRNMRHIVVIVIGIQMRISPVKIITYCEFLRCRETRFYERKYCVDVEVVHDNIRCEPLLISS